MAPDAPGAKEKELTVDVFVARATQLVQRLGRAKRTVSQEIHEAELRLKRLEQQIRQNTRASNAIAAGQRLRGDGVANADGANESDERSNKQRRTEEPSDAMEAHDTESAAPAVEQATGAEHASGQVADGHAALSGTEEGSPTKAVGMDAHAEAELDERGADGVPANRSSAALTRSKTSESTASGRGEARPRPRVPIDDVATKQRNRNMFGVLMGTLKRAR